MSTTILDRVVEVEDQIVDSIGQVKEPVVSATEAATKFVQERVEVALRPVPMAEKLPTPEEVLNAQFDFASKRLEVGLAPITGVHVARAQYDAARAHTILARNAHSATAFFRIPGNRLIELGTQVEI